VSNRLSNILAYKILGSDPLKPSENRNWNSGTDPNIESSAEISHPSLAPDGDNDRLCSKDHQLESSGDGTGGLVLK